MEVKNCKLVKTISCNEADNCVKVARLMRDKKERHVIVCKGISPVGIISSVDLVNEVLAEGKDPRKLKAKNVMVCPVHILDSNDSIFKAYFEMVKKNIYSCPVVDKGRLIGSLTLHDALKSMRSKEQTEKKWPQAV